MMDSGYEDYRADRDCRFEAAEDRAAITRKILREAEAERELLLRIGMHLVNRASRKELQSVILAFSRYSVQDDYPDVRDILQAAERRLQVIC